MEQSKNELIKEIANLFEDYEESYVPGEWEAFQKQRRKKYPFISRWIKVAAVLLLVTSVLPFGVKKLLEVGKNGGTIVKNRNIPAKKALNQITIDGNSSKIDMSDTSRAKATASNTHVRSTSLQNQEKLHQANAHPPDPPQIRTADLVKVQSGLLQIPASVKTGEVANANVLQLTNSKTGLLADLATSSNTTDQSYAKQFPAQDQVKRSRADQPVMDSAAVRASGRPSTIEFLLAESKKTQPKKTNKEGLSKWDFGLLVMPTATRTSMNFGGGLVTAYHISEKLSLSSGINLLQLGSGENVPQAVSSMAADASFANAGTTAQGSKQLLSVDASIKAIDIPLGLVYKVNKHYYTSAGISYFNVLSEKRNNTYSETVSVSRTSTDPVTGNMRSYSALEIRQVDEETTDRPLKGNSYLGFFNFSIGRRQNIFKQYNIQIEPFIKVPIGKLSSQDLNLMNSGVKFQLSF